MNLVLRNHIGRGESNLLGIDQLVLDANEVCLLSGDQKVVTLNRRLGYRSGDVNLDNLLRWLHLLRLLHHLPNLNHLRLRLWLRLWHHLLNLNRLGLLLRVGHLVDGLDTNQVALLIGEEDIVSLNCWHWHGSRGIYLDHWGLLNLWLLHHLSDLNHLRLLLSLLHLKHS